MCIYIRINPNKSSRAFLDTSLKCLHIYVCAGRYVSGKLFKFSISRLYIIHSRTAHLLLAHFPCNIRVYSIII